MHSAQVVLQIKLTYSYKSQTIYQYINRFDVYLV